MKYFFTTLKDDIFMKLYLILFTALNSLYLCLEIYKTSITETLGANNSIQKTEFDSLARISSINVAIETLLILLVLGFLLINMFMYRNRIKTIWLLLFQMLIISMFYFIGFILAIIFPTPLGNLTQQLFVVSGITTITLIYYLTRKQ